MAIACDPASLAKASTCFVGFDEGQLLQVQTYLLAVIAGGSLDPKTLMKAATCFSGLSEGQLLQIQSYLLCSLVGP
jgi:hypothetical protein